jgi:hypothetical protein
MGFTISATVTAKTGPASQITAKVFPGITAITIDTKREVIQLYQETELTGPCLELDLHGVTTITDMITAGNHAVVIS